MRIENQNIEYKLLWKDDFLKNVWRGTELRAESKHEGEGRCLAASINVNFRMRPKLK
jgi:hypothetical protein